MLLDWLIIGGGIHGTSLSLFLTARKGVPRDRVRVLDPYDQPLALWDTLTANVGMDFLRSSHAHNLHDDPFSLTTFARTRRGEPLARFTDPYGRPSLELFGAHNNHLIERHQLDSLRVQGRARGLTRIEGGWRVETSNGSLESRRVLIAIGMTEQPYWPPWAQRLRAAGAPIHHIFDPQFNQMKAHRPEGEGLGVRNWQHAVVVGGGITAAQTALSLAVHAPVTLLMRHPARVHHFDSDPCWVTSICLATFHQERDYNRRRAIIREARHRGSIPPDVARQLQDAVVAGFVTRRLGEAQDAAFAEQVSLRLGVENIEADLVVLATGFESARPGGTWLDSAVEELHLPVAECGFPIVDRTLCWQPGLYVTGPLAELEIGPVARNIIGARLAAWRLADAV